MDQSSSLVDSNPFSLCLSSPRSAASRHSRVRSIGQWFGIGSAEAKKKEPAAKDEEAFFTPKKIHEKVQEERMSRHLYSGSTLKRLSTRTGSLFEFFAIVSWGDPNPAVVFTWPAEQPSHERINYFSRFCMPYTDIADAMDEEFVFTISSEDNSDERLVCVCAVAAMPLETATDVTLVSEKKLHRRSMSHGMVDTANVNVVLSTAPRCYVFASRYPFVDLMLHVLRGIIAEEKKRHSPDDLGRLLQSLHGPVPAIGRELQVVSRFGAEPSLTWCRAEDQEEVLLGAWNGDLAFRLLDKGSPPLLMQVLSCVMLEQQVVLTSKSLENVSAVVLALMACMRPFQYQCVLLPVVPPALEDLLDAPVPFLLGMHASCVSDSIGAIVVNLDAGTIRSRGPILKLPQESDLVAQLRPLLDLLDSMPLAAPISVQAARAVMEKLTRYWNDLFRNFRRHCMRDLTNPEEPVTIFMKEAFIDEQPTSEGKLWLSGFFETQMWAHHSDSNRTRFDLLRRDSIMQARTPKQLSKNDEEEEEEEEVDPTYIDMLIAQCNCSAAEAKKALQEQGGDLVNAMLAVSK